MKYRVVRTNVDPVTLDETKQHCRVTDTREDSIIRTYIRSAVLQAENYIDQLIMSGRVEEEYASFETGGFKTKYQVNSLPIIKYYDKDGVQQTLSTDVYTYQVQDNYAKIVLKEDQVWPETEKDRPLSITITYDSGMTDNREEVPTDIKSAIFLIVNRMYENRADYVDKLPTASKNILHPYRRNWL